MNKVVISQPRYLPVMTYLKRLYFADKFVFLDNVQRQSRGWENRNIIFIDGKVRWLTIPVSSSTRELIKNSIISNSSWINSHKEIIRNAYRKYPYFDNKIIEMYYSGIDKTIVRSNYHFTDVVVQLISNACKIFGFKPKTVKSSLLTGTDEIKGPRKLLRICQDLKASSYITGKNGLQYGIADIFKNTGIKLLIHREDFPLYQQYKISNFIPYLCFFDPIFNLGIQKVKAWIYEKSKLDVI